MVDLDDIRAILFTVIRLRDSKSQLYALIESFGFGAATSQSACKNQEARYRHQSPESAFVRLPPPGPLPRHKTMAPSNDQYGAVEAGEEAQPLTHQSEAKSTPKVVAAPATRRNLLPKLVMGMAILGAAGVVYSSSTRTAEAEAEAEVDLWTRLSDPDELLLYVAQHQIEQLGDDYTLDDGELSHCGAYYASSSSSMLATFFCSWVGHRRGGGDLAIGPTHCMCTTDRSSAQRRYRYP